ncbi:HalOD1 output domain-containing protein [Halorussus sp. AFM4]|uniref:HalOD1 output domain-containing protein n=1 Tax=Halorussus sp. AFM4 TaxID=3421651 RepID=UPI003EB8EDA0
MNRDTPNITERAPSLDRDGRPAYRVAPSEWSVSTTVVTAVTEVLDADPLADEGLLYDALDPEALDCLFADRADGASRSSGRVVFSLRECEVEVHATGAVVVFGPEEHDGAGSSTPQSA